MINENYPLKDEKRFITRPLFKQIALFSLSAAAFAVLLLNAEEISGAVYSSMAMCAGSLIPSLFVFTIAAGFLIDSGVCAYIGGAFSPLTSFFWGMSGASATVLLLGMISGYPIAADCAAKLYKKGELTLSEARRLSVFANNAGPAYVIIGIGVTLRGSLREGVIIWLSQIFSAVLLGIILKSNHKKSEKPLLNRSLSSFTSFSSAFVHSVDSAARSMVKITGFIACFSAVTAIAELFLRKFSFTLPLLVQALLFGMAEVTGGAARASAISGIKGICVTAFLVSFSGLSVAMQTSSVEDSVSRLKFYLSLKFVQGILSVLICFLLCLIFII